MYQTEKIPSFCMERPLTILLRPEVEVIAPVSSMNATTVTSSVRAVRTVDTGLGCCEKKL